MAAVFGIVAAEVPFSSSSRIKKKNTPTRSTGSMLVDLEKHMEFLGEGRGL
jgi:hypothetical protein